MKKVLLLTVLMTLVMSCNTEEKSTLPPDTYQVNVTGKGIYNGLRGHLNLMNSKRREVSIDTAMFLNETATFTGTVTNPAIRYLTINGVKGNLELVLEPGITTIVVDKDNIKLSTIEGGENTKIYNLYKSSFNKQVEEIKAIRKEANKVRREGDEEKFQELTLQGDIKVKGVENFAHKFISEHPDSNYSLLLLESLMSEKKNLNTNQLKANLASLQNLINKNPENVLIGKKIEAYIAQKEAVKNTDIGRVAPNFSALTPAGNELALNDIKGKATIIDFWASWCGPCRRENPNVVKVYEKYHDKGLEIISVSLDRSNQRDRWLKAIEKDKMTWHHVSNLQYWNDPIARQYSVRSIPAMFVLDENGKIVAKKLRGKALEDQIASMLN